MVCIWIVWHIETKLTDVYCIDCCVDCGWNANVVGEFENSWIFSTGKLVDQTVVDTQHCYFHIAKISKTIKIGVPVQ